MIEVRVSTAHPKPGCDSPIERGQQRSPALKLPNVMPLMLAACFQTERVAGQDDMPQRHRGAALAKPASTQQPRHETAVGLDHSVMKPH